MATSAVPPLLCARLEIKFELLFETIKHTPRHSLARIASFSALPY
jgi:hypothetical protein